MEELEWKAIRNALERGESGPFDKLKLGGKYAEIQPKSRKKATHAEDKTVKPIRAIVKDGSSQMRELNEWWGRCCVVLDGRPAGIRSGMKIFLAELARITQARFIWTGPKPTSVRRVIAKDLKLCAELIRGVRSQLFPFEGVFSTDGWTHTNSHRHFLGANYQYLSPNWYPCTVAFAFHGAHVEQDMLINESAHGARAFAIATTKSWRTMCARVAPHEDIDLPWVGMSDNATAAVAVTKNLSRSPGRCTVHVLNIPINALVFAGMSREQHGWVAPLNHPFREAFHAIEAARNIGLWFKGPDVRAEWVRKRCGGPRCAFPRVDSPSKWNSPLNMITRLIKLKPNLERFHRSMRHMSAGPIPALLADSQ